MAGLRQATINLMAAGLFHLLEQQLAKLTFDDGFQGIHMHPNDANLGPSAKLLSWCREALRDRLEGPPAVGDHRPTAAGGERRQARRRWQRQRELRGKREELFRNPALKRINLSSPDYERWPLRSPLTGEDLFVTKQIFTEYANAAHDFMAAIVALFRP